MDSILDSLKALLVSSGAVVDAAVPFAKGDRTKIAVIVVGVAWVASQVLCRVYAPACFVVARVGDTAGMLAPIFAWAGLVRPKSPVA